ncbi:MAG TPA: NAD-dependent epimerase/dehydratase family protein [Ruminiclostridium sp.]
MKVVIIGGCGHIGTYLVPKLVKTGYQVVNVARGNSQPYLQSSAWQEVESVKLDRNEEDKKGTFGKKIAALNADIVIDLITFNAESTYQMVEALKNTNLSQYLFCASIWAHGHATIVPATEDLPRHPLEEYGINKAKSEAYLHEQYRREGFPETVVMPGHITGPGWTGINPTGNLDPMIFQKIGRGEEIVLPNMGMETVHHVHADDVAQVFMNSILYRGQALGESFHAVAPQAMTLLGYAEAMYSWFGKEAKISFLPWKEWCEYTKVESFINSTFAHVTHSDNYSIEKGKRLINYNPRYTILQAVEESVNSMLERKIITI